MSEFVAGVDFERLQKRLAELRPGKSVFEDWTQMEPGGVGEALTVPFWGDQPEAWNRVYISGVVLPGIATVSGTGYKRRVDRRKTAGQHGESMTDLGDDCSEIEIILTLWTEQHLRDFQAVVRRIIRKRGKARTGVKGATSPGSPTLEEQQFFVGLSSGATAFTPGTPYGTYELPTSTPARPDAAFEQAMKYGTPTYTPVKTSNADVEDAPAPLDVVHPALAIYRIRSVQIVEASLPTPKGKDIFEVRLKGREFIDKRATKVTTADQSVSLTAALGGNAIDRRIAAKPKAVKPSATISGPGV